MLHANNRAMSFACPNTSHYRFQPYAMLVHAPQLNQILGKVLLDLVELLRQFAFELLLPILISFVVARARYLKGKPNSFEVIPSSLGVNRSPDLTTHPECDFLACP